MTDYEEAIRSLSAKSYRQTANGKYEIFISNHSKSYSLGTYNSEKDAKEELTAYVRQIEELREGEDGYYLEKTKMTPYGQAIITSPLPQPPMKVGKLHVGKNGVASITEIPEEEE